MRRHPEPFRRRARARRTRSIVLAGAVFFGLAVSSASGTSASAALQVGTIGAADSTRIAELEAEMRARPTDARGYLRLARAYASLNRPERAETVLRSGLDRATEPGPVRWALVGLFADRERWADALAAAEPLGPGPRVRDLLIRLRANAGLEAYRAGDAERARTLWERALRDDPTLAVVGRNLGALLLESGEPDSARTVVERALEHSPDDEHLLALRAATLGGREGMEAAIDAARAARRSRPDDEALALRLARLLAWSGDSGAAAALYDTLTAAPDASGDAYGAAARFWLERGRWDRTAELARAGTEREPTNGELWRLLGEAEALGADWRGAAAAYRRAATLLDDPVPAHLGLLEASGEAADTAAALAVVRTMVERGEAPRDALLRAAETARDLGGATAAASVYRRLLARDADDARALAGAGAVAEASGDTARALESYRRALSAGGGPGAALGVLRLERPGAERRRELLRSALWRGIASLQELEIETLGALRTGSGLGAARRARPTVDRREDIGRTVIAVLDTVVFGTDWGGDELERLREAYPRSSLLRRYAGRLAVERGRPGDALGHYDRLLRRNAADVEAHRGRGRALAALDRTDAAIEAYSRALELEPEDEPAFRALVRLRERDGSLEALLRRVRRIRVRRPESAVLIDREIELLHRLGRTAEADSLARSQAPPGAS